jgi:WD40 repeat protein
MAVHPIYPLLAVCDDENIYLHLINTDHPMHLPLIHLGQYVDASCIAFHATHPLVAASGNDTGEITFWNIQEVIARLDEVPFNVEERRNELKQMLSQTDDANKLEELEEKLADLENYRGSELKSFATLTMVNPTYITFHPTMPYIVVGGVDYHESESSFIKIFEVNINIEPVEVNSIEFPMDKDDSYDKIKSIVFSHDGVFLAATFGKVIIVWFFSPTEEMKQLMNLRLSNEVNSLVFSPIDYILVASYNWLASYPANWHNAFRSFKIEKASSVPENLTKVEGWAATNIEHYAAAAAAISTLAFHPTLPLLVGGFDNGDVKYYVFDIDDLLSELTRFSFRNPIPFQDRSRQPSVALNRQFLVTCGSNQVLVYTMDGVESAVERFGDKLRYMSHAARASLAIKGMPEGVRHLVLNKTPYGNSLKRSIAFLKTTMDKKGFLDLIRGRPLWLIGIMQQFIDLLKLTPNLPPILVPFEELITKFVPYHSVSIATCDRIVENFITANELDPERAVVKKIKLFFNRVFDILVNQSHHSVRKDIESEKILPILQELFTLNQIETNHMFIRDIDLKGLLEYDQAEQAFTQKHKKEHQQGGRKKKTRARTYKKNRTRARRKFH